MKNLHKTMEKIIKGIYRHYKGNEYLVIGEATNSEDKEAQVLYRDLNTEKLWSRPKKMFLEEVETKEGKVDRFEFISEESEDSWENKYLRALADYQNLSRQTIKDEQEFVKFATADFLTDLLPIYDHLKLSIQGLSEKEQISAWAIGVKYVLKQFKDLLSTRGVEEIETTGKSFNHDTMEALEGEGEMIDKEVMPGYILHGKVIRPAKVTVKKNKGDEKNE